MDPLAETTARAPPMEQFVIATQLLLHMVDMMLHGAIAVSIYLEPTISQWCFALVVAIVGWSTLVSSCYVAFGQVPGNEQVNTFLCSIGQIQIVREARKAIRVYGESDYFHTLRLLQGILQSAPMSLVTIYLVLLADVHVIRLTPNVESLLLASATTSVLSLASGLALWEQKVCRTALGDPYILMLLGFRLAEIMSRVLTLALFGLRLSCGMMVTVVLLDFMCMLLLISRQGAVQLMYGIFVAIPLVFVSMEPTVWKREDHAVPKEIYYPVRAVEFIVMWYCISFGINWNVATSPLVQHCLGLALLSTFILYLALPIVWKMARRREIELLQVTDNCLYGDGWLEDEWRTPFAKHIRNSDSDTDSEGSNTAGE
eukprot:GEMP01018643.1.p1 GENE.GEMP01018643.1~~GEMP01018643.1.p1  ORF type:complete len:372 (+),score=82.92 GEMP01018643.1:199-1314(+)